MVAATLGHRHVAIVYIVPPSSVSGCSPHYRLTSFNGCCAWWGDHEYEPAEWVKHPGEMGVKAIHDGTLMPVGKSWVCGGISSLRSFDSQLDHAFIERLVRHHVTSMLPGVV